MFAKTTAVVLATASLAAAAPSQADTAAEKTAARIGAAHWRPMIHSRFPAVTFGVSFCVGDSSYFACSLMLNYKGERLGWWDWSATGRPGHYVYSEIKFKRA